MKNIFKIIEEWLAVRLEIAKFDLYIIKKRYSVENWWAETGRRIDEIARLYPAMDEDAIIIFEEWCKGVLTECRPDPEMLREYAKYTANSDRYRDWVRIIWKKT